MPEEKKIILTVSIHDDKDKSKAMAAVSGIGGITSISVDPKDYKMTVIGDVDPVKITEKLRKKHWQANIVSVGPAKEEKKEEKKKEEPKKDEEAEKKKMAELLEACKNYNLHCPPNSRYYYYVHSAEDDPNGCVIC